MKVFDRLILEKIWDRKEYYWDFNGYKIPRIIHPGARKIEAVLDIEHHHNQLMSNNKSLPNVIRFKEFMKKEFGNIRVIEEFPVPICSSLWKEIYSDHGGKKPGTIEKTWFSLDFYLPEYGVAIQLDSKIGHGTKDNQIRDLSEDIYLWYQHGITTIRSSKLQFDNLVDEEKERLRKEIKSLKPKEATLDFKGVFVEFIKSYYEVELGFIKKYLLNNLIYNEITGEKITNKNIEISEKDLSYKDKNSLDDTVKNSFIMGGIELSLRENVKYLFRILFDEDLKLKP